MKKLNPDINLATICLFVFVAVGSTSSVLDDFPLPEGDIDPLFNIKNRRKGGNRPIWRRPIPRPRPSRRPQPIHHFWNPSQVLRGRSEDLSALIDLIGENLSGGGAAIDPGFNRPSSISGPSDIDIDPGFSRPSHSSQTRPSFPWWEIFQGGNKPPQWDDPRLRGRSEDLSALQSLIDDSAAGGGANIDPGFNRPSSVSWPKVGPPPKPPKGYRPVAIDPSFGPRPPNRPRPVTSNPSMAPRPPKGNRPVAIDPSFGPRPPNRPRPGGIDPGFVRPSGNPRPPWWWIYRVLNPSNKPPRWDNPLLRGRSEIDIFSPVPDAKSIPSTSDWIPNVVGNRYDEDFG